MILSWQYGPAWLVDFPNKSLLLFTSFRNEPDTKIARETAMEVMVKDTTFTFKKNSDYNMVFCGCKQSVYALVNRPADQWSTESRYCCHGYRPHESETGPDSGHRSFEIEAFLPYYFVGFKF